MKAIIPSMLLAWMVASCRSVIQPQDPPEPMCMFAADTLSNMRNVPISDESLDSSRSYTYSTQAVSMDSLLPALCTAGVHIDSAYFVTEYLCKDARGPRPVVVLAAADGTMLNRGFALGANGRLACASKIVLYTPTR